MRTENTENASVGFTCHCKKPGYRIQKHCHSQLGSWSALLSKDGLKTLIVLTLPPRRTTLPLHSALRALQMTLVHEKHPMDWNVFCCACLTTSVLGLTFRLPKQVHSSTCATPYPRLRWFLVLSFDRDGLIYNATIKL